MPISRTPNDFNEFADWESFEGEDSIYMGIETDLLDDWEDDGSITQLRETPIEKPKAVKKKTTKKSDDAKVFSIMDSKNKKGKKDLVSISGPSEEELLEIENIGVESYIDNVLNDEEDIREKILKYEEIEMQVELEEQEPEIIEDEIILEEIEPQIEPEAVLKKAPIVSIGENHSDIDLNVQPVFTGLGCPLITLFDEDQEVEYKLTARLAKRLTSSHVNSIFVGTKDGEGQTLSDVEKIKLVKEIKKSVDKNCAVIADVSSASIRQSVSLAKEFVGLNVDSLCIDIDSNIKDVYQLLESLHNAAYDLPILIRLVGDHSLLTVAPEFLYELPIAGIIDATGDASYLLHLTAAYSGPVYVGSTSLLLMANSLGVQGVVLAGIAQDEDLILKAFGGDVDAQHELAMIERDNPGTEIEQIKLNLEGAMLISPTMRD